jgi:hypothetical protein
VKPAFLITIDTEGDDFWSHPHQITTHNAKWLPRFQSCCEDYGFIPTYLTNYEMVVCPDFQRFDKAVLRRGAAEIGMHLHAWNSPADHLAHRRRLRVRAVPDRVCARDHPSQGELHDGSLRETFECEITSHRAGRC